MARRNSSSPNPRRNRRGGRGKPQRNFKKIALLTILPLTAVGLSGALLHYHSTTPKIGADFCFDGATQVQHDLVFENSFTHGLSDNLQRDYQRIPMQAYAQAAPNTVFNFYSTASDQESSIAKPIASICKPPQTVNDTEYLGVPSKPQPYLDNQAARAKTAYDTIVANVLTDAQNPDKAAKDSAILELVQSVSRNHENKGDARKLTLISDGLQNSETARFCMIKGDLPPFATFKTQSRYRAVAPEDFDGADIEIMLVEHGRLPARGMEHCSNQEVRQFWEDYFKGNGAGNVRLTRLRYGAE